MSDKFKEIREIIHSISNRMFVVDHLLKIYAKNLPEHKLTKIGLEAAALTKDELKELKEMIITLEQSKSVKEEVIETEKVISLTDWKHKLESMKETLSEMSTFSIGIQSSKLPEKSVYIDLDDITSEIGLYFEEVAMTGATQMNINMIANDKDLKLSFSDDGDGSIDSKSQNIISLKNTLESKSIKADLRAIPEVGANLTLRIKVVS